ncbi:hypothetical protein FB45DRAFT_1127918 [Roridomyces roridus]|uniref:F-box domain-containing protein n=1 Tax=Roridomyces roridus TaxID=1738132 RepID=A0AAD7B353_9AGAR|nr:hypothetical protein FB45DRAFT_1127918 [Roridomyces roridus]
MPPEILSEVFLWTVSSLMTRWRVSQVSHRWREVVLSTPSLWSLVFVPRRKAGLLPMIEAQVKRAQSLNLKIHFYGSDAVTESTNQIQLFEFLSEHSLRWEELFVRLAAGMVPLMKKLRGRLPCLRRLSVRWYNAKSQIGVDSIKCFNTASSLEDVELHSFRCIPIPFPTDRLTSYRVKGPLELHQQVLKMAPNIIEARVVVAFDLDQPWPEPSGPAIDMLHLKRLYVTHIEILDYLRAPSVAELAIDFSTIDGNSAAIDCLEAFLLRSSCRPPQLCVQNFPDVSLTAQILEKYTFITIRKNLPGYFIANLSKISCSSNILQSFSKLLPNVDKVSKMEILLFISMTLGT